MVRTIRFKDAGRLQLIRELQCAAGREGSAIWGNVAERLAKSRSLRPEVNLHKINRHTSDGDVVVIPGKVLGSGRLEHPVEVAAYRFTDGARAEIEKAGGKALTIHELLKHNTRGSNIKVIA